VRDFSAFVDVLTKILVKKKYIKYNIYIFDILGYTRQSIQVLTLFFVTVRISQ